VSTGRKYTSNGWEVCKHVDVRFLTGVLATSNVSGAIPAGGVRLSSHSCHHFVVAGCLTSAWTWCAVSTTRLQDTAPVIADRFDRTGL